MFERVRISAKGKQQIIQIKRKTGIEQYNAICRFALVLSLKHETFPPKEELLFAGGIEMDWHIFCGGEEAIYEDLLLLRCKKDDLEATQDNLKEVFQSHLHRGLAYLVANPSLLDV